MGHYLVIDAGPRQDIDHLGKRIGEIRDHVVGKGVAEHDNAVRQGSLWVLKDLDQAPAF